MGFSSNVVIIGSSSGGPQTLRRVFANMPAINACFLIVQHMPRFINESFKKSLSTVTDMRIRIAEDGALLENRTILVAPSEAHMELEGNRRIRLRNGKKINFVCPSIDVTMQSVKSELRIFPIAVVLTGIGKDGAKGISHIKYLGGKTIAQDSETSIVYGMPKAAALTGDVDFVLTPEAIGGKITKLLKA